jgi:hypothetical protein
MSIRVRSTSNWFLGDHRPAVCPTDSSRRMCAECSLYTVVIRNKLVYEVKESASSLPAMVRMHAVCVQATATARADGCCRDDVSSACL